MSDFPLLCRVLQDYDSTQHHARQTSTSSNDVFVSPTRKNDSVANNGTPVHQNRPLPSSNSKQESFTQSDNVFTPSNKQLPQLSQLPQLPRLPQALVEQNRGRTSSDVSSDFETSWGKSTTVSYVSGCRDSHDYDELESMIEHLKKKKAGSPRRSPPRAPVKIFGGVSVLPIPFKTSPSVPGGASGGNVLRKESMKRSQSADDIFDDPKYTRLSVGSSTSAQPMIVSDNETYDHLELDAAIEKLKYVKQPLSKKRSFSTSATEDKTVERRNYKEYMSLQLLLEIMEAKIPSREASEETEDTEERLYCPRVLRPVQV